MLEGFQRLGGLLVRGPLIRTLESPAPVLLLSTRQVRDHVLPFVPLAPLDQHLVLEGREHAAPEPLGPVDHHERSGRQIETSVLQAPEEGPDHHRVLRVGLDEAEEHLVPLKRHAERHHHLVLGEALPVQDERHHVIDREVPLLKLLQPRERWPS